ncbi:MAG: peptidylprolyl isomerase [Rhodoferax sp.]
MNAPVPRVAPGAFLTLHYRLSGPAGDVVTTFDGPPATLTLGTGALAPAIEARLIGLAEGTHTTLEIPAGEAFGPRSPDMVQWMARKVLDDMGPEGETWAVGDVVKFPTPDGQGEFAGVILALRDDPQAPEVQFDFNHPLAGQPVRFEVKIIGVL